MRFDKNRSPISGDVQSTWKFAACSFSTLSIFTDRQTLCFPDLISRTAASITPDRNNHLLQILPAGKSDGCRNPPDIAAGT